MVSSWRTQRPASAFFIAILFFMRKIAIGDLLRAITPFLDLPVVLIVFLFHCRSRRDGRLLSVRTERSERNAGALPLDPLRRQNRSAAVLLSTSTTSLKAAANSPGLKHCRRFAACGRPLTNLFYFAASLAVKRRTTRTFILFSNFILQPFSKRTQHYVKIYIIATKFSAKSFVAIGTPV